MKSFLCVLISFTLGSVAIASTSQGYDIALHQSGAEAQAIYNALHVPELHEKAAFASPEVKTYKVGKNILCLKTMKSAADAESTATYLCSSGFNPRGESEASGPSNKR